MSPTMACTAALMASTVLANCANTAQFSPSSYAKNNVLTADVVVLGGGSSGTFGAITLKDAGKSVIVVEKNDHLGGHFETYIDPATGTAVDYGVQTLLNTSVVTNFFARFHIPITQWALPSVPFVVADFTTGQNVSSAISQSDFSGYIAQYNKYPNVSNTTAYANPPPADFSIPFSQFITKYNLQDEAYAIYTSPGCSGQGTMLNQPTLSVLRCLNDAVFEELAGDGIATANGNFSALFKAAQAELGSSALLSTTVVAAARSSSGVAIVVQTGSTLKLVLAKQALVAYPQDSANMNPLCPDSTEQAVFPKFTWSAWYTGLVKNTGLGLNYYLNAGANTLYNIPNLPGTYHISPTAVSGLYNFWYGADTPVDQSKVQSDLFANINKLTGKVQTPQIVAYGNHTPYNLHFDSADIKAGLYTKFTNLQGYRSTYYTGAVIALGSGELWPVTKSIVQKMVAAK